MTTRHDPIRSHESKTNFLGLQTLRMNVPCGTRIFREAQKIYVLVTIENIKIKTLLAVRYRIESSE
jgi:hypothetical protein